MSNKLLPESKRTVTFTEEEAQLISEIIFGFSTNDVTESLEEVAQNLFNNIDGNSLCPDFGNHYFLLRQLRRFHAGLINRLKPVGEAYQKIR